MKPNFFRALGAGFTKRMNRVSTRPPAIEYAYDNDYPMAFMNAAGTGTVEALRTDNLDAVQVASQVVKPHYKTISFPLSTNGSLGDQCFFVVPFAMTIVGITEIHATAGNDSGAVTLNITHETGTQVPAAGTSVMSGTFNLKGTANTLQTATLASDPQNTILRCASGDRLSANFTGTLTTLAGVVVTIAFTPFGRGDCAVFQMQANGDLADQCFYIANRPRKVATIHYVHSTLGTNGSAVNVQVTKDTSTNAPGAGTDLLTNNTNAGFNCKAAINTVQTGTLSATESDLWLMPGDRLSVDFAGTLTALAGVVIVVTFLPNWERFKSITFNLAKNGNLADQAFWIADGSYRIVDAREVHSAAGNDGGAVTAQITVDRLTDAPGAGTDLFSDNTNAGFDLKGTANTVQVGTFKSEAVRYIKEGDRLSIDFAGTLTTLAGVVATIDLQAA